MFFPPKFQNSQNLPYLLYPQNFSYSQNYKKCTKFVIIFFFPPLNFFNKKYENFAFPYFTPKFSTGPPLNMASCKSNQSDPCSISDSQTPSIVVQPRIDNFNLNEQAKVDRGEKRQA